MNVDLNEPNLRDLFDQLVDASRGEQDVELARLRRDHAALASELEALLAVERGGIALDDAANQAVGSAIAASAGTAAREGTFGANGALAVGDRVGPYRLERELGRGGMGIVFAARRDDAAYRSTVAVKVLRHRAESADLEARFRTERQILADLDHPNIARLLDGGATDDGRPYLVMEYIEGTSFTEYCDSHALDPEARLRLFGKVCDAVRFAHRNLIVHRDLKPGNILVDEQGEPKLLDFGIAKLLDPQSVPHTMAETHVHSRLMTPDYASPEQIMGKPISTASDVYSLGVLLYELLTGTVPHSGETLPQAVERVLADTAPKRPSRVVTTQRRLSAVQPASDFGSDVGGRADGGTLRLRKVLEGDLDFITLKALRSEPERRYLSVSEFAEDIERYLAGLPISARPATTGYRLKRFVARNRRATALASATLVGIVSLVAFYTLRLREERTQAQEQAARATQVAEFLTELFEISDPSRSQGEAITARELLDQGAQRIDALADQPSTQAALMDVMGNVYRTLALYRESEALVSEALAVRRRLAGGRPSADVAESLQSLGRLRAAQGDGPAAESLHSEAQDLWLTLDLGDSEAMARSLNDLGSALFVNGDYVAAEQAHRQALSIQRRLRDQPPDELAHSVDRLAAAQHEQGLYEDAEANYREALALRIDALGEESLEVANSYSNLGNLLRFLDRSEECEQAHRRSLEIRRRVLGPGHPNLTTSLNSLAVLLASEGRLEEALPMFEEALDIRVTSLGRDHPRVGVPLTGLADALRRSGRLQEAEERYVESVALHRNTLPENHPFIAHPIAGLASTRSAMGEHEAAARLYEEALAIRRTSLEPTHWRIASTESLLGRELVALGRYDEGVALLRAAAETLETLLGDDNSRTVSAVDRLKQALTELPTGFSD